MKDKLGVLESRITGCESTRTDHHFTGCSFESKTCAQHFDDSLARFYSNEYFKFGHVFVDSCKEFELIEKSVDFRVISRDNGDTR